MLQVMVKWKNFRSHLKVYIKCCVLRVIGSVRENAVCFGVWCDVVLHPADIVHSVGERL